MNWKDTATVLRKWFESRDGFTLIELIAVLVLLGVLSGVATVKYYDLQVEAQTLTVKQAVNELNADVRQVFKKNKMNDESTGPYQGYTGYLGTSVIVTGQALDTPSSGTIKIASGSKTYNLIWEPGPENGKAHGRFKLGSQI